MAPKAMKRPASAIKRPAAAKRPATTLARPASAKSAAKPPAAKPAAAKPAAAPPVEEEEDMAPAEEAGDQEEAPAAEAPVELPEVLKSLKAHVINLERRPDRWTRVEDMLRKEVPWLSYERLLASDGSQKPIPAEEVAETWNTKCNARYADYYEWVFDGPPEDAARWKWAADAGDDDEWGFTEEGEDEWSFIHHAPGYLEKAGAELEKNDEKLWTAKLVKKATEEEFKLRLRFDKESLIPGKTMKMSGGERGCAHSHLRLWRLAAECSEPTVALEDDVQMVFDRADSSMGQCNGKVFTERLAKALELAPTDFDVIYLGWSGWRDGHGLRVASSSTQKLPIQDDATKYVRAAEYVWTTVAYVISQKGAKKLLEAAAPINQPVDNFMATECAEGRLQSFVMLDEADDDGTWAGGIVDQFDFQGDSDIKKSDGGHQGDDEKEFAVQE